MLVSGVREVDVVLRTSRPLTCAQCCCCCHYALGAGLLSTCLKWGVTSAAGVAVLYPRFAFGSLYQKVATKVDLSTSPASLRLKMVRSYRLVYVSDVAQKHSLTSTENTSHPSASARSAQQAPIASGHPNLPPKPPARVPLVLARLTSEPTRMSFAGM